jgi:acetyltransferase-like isoleucine patch superfamily enzyme
MSVQSLIMWQDEMITLKLIMKRIFQRIVKLRNRGETLNFLISAGHETYGLKNINLHFWNNENVLQIGNYCSIADRCHIFLGGNHDLNRISTFPFGDGSTTEMIGDREGHPLSNGDVVIGHDVWIASGVTIMSGVRIGSGAVVAANSHVIRDVKPYEVVGGNPAKHIKFRFSEPVITELLKIQWWNLEREVIMGIRNLLTSLPDDDVLAELKKISDT